MTKTKLSNNGLSDNQISQAEKNLFAQALTDVRPLASDAQFSVSKSVAKQKSGEKIQQQGSLSYRCQLPLSDHYQPVGALQTFSFHRTSDRKVLTKLKSAKMETQAVIDLHGLRLEQAAQELSTAMTNWLNRGLRVVRIVHGKGQKQGYSVIKSHIPRWLESIPQVLAYCSCRQENGGTGAVMVLLKNTQKHQQGFKPSG